MKKLFLVSAIATAMGFAATSSIASTQKCEEVTEEDVACVFADGISAYHTTQGFFITSEVQGTAKVAVFPGVRTAEDLWDGVKNTDAILAHSEVFPAAHICRDLGEDWYLPAAKELHKGFLYLLKNKPLVNHQFLTSTFVRSGFGTETVGMLDSNAQYVFPSLGNAGLMSNREDYSVICARSTADK